MDQVDWIQEMIQREAKPEILRLDTIESFCINHGIEVSQYNNEKRKEENKKKIIDEMLNIAVDNASDVMQVLKEKALSGEVKAIEMYIDYILKLSKKIDPSIMPVMVSQNEVEKLLERLNQ